LLRRHVIASASSKDFLIVDNHQSRRAAGERTLGNLRV
jgi:hypothetical protein